MKAFVFFLVVHSTLAFKVWGPLPAKEHISRKTIMGVEKKHVISLQKPLQVALGAFLAFNSGSFLHPLSNPPAAHAARSSSNAASSQGSRVNKDAESLLRYGLPINSKEARTLQEQVEAIKDEIRAKRISAGRSDVSKAKTTIKNQGAAIVKAARPSEKEAVQKLFTEMVDKLDALEQTLAEDVGRGSEQERSMLDRAYALQAQVSSKLTTVEEKLVPEGYKVSVPEEYSSLPQLQGRATVQFVLKKPDGSKFDIKGKLFDEVKLKMVIDGYNAPITAGNFVDLVQTGFYKGLPMTRSDGFVVQFGDPQPEGTIHGYVPSGKKDVRNIPLEIFVKGDSEPLYGSTTEDDLRGYAATVLPFQAYGAIGMAREEYNADSASSQVFWLLFESDLTPAGKNLLDGRYACFGYTIENAELLLGVKEGDIIADAKVLDGLENFKSGA